MPDVTKYADPVEEEVNLLPSKWNRNCDGAWVMVVDVIVGDMEDTADELIAGDDTVESEDGYETDDDGYDSEDVLLCDLKKI